MVTTTVRLPEDLIEGVDEVLAEQREYRSRSHLMESLLQDWLDGEDGEEDPQGDLPFGEND